MLRKIIIFCFVLTGLDIHAQSTIGYTSIPDTGYNVQAEYRKNIRSFPFIKVAERNFPTSVKLDSNITYCAINNKQLKLDVFYPATSNAKPLKTIIFIHGGGWRSGNRSMHYALAEKLALKGIVCITPSYRLSTEALYPAAIQDVKTVIRWTRDNAFQYNIDTNAIIIAGHSAGGQLAALAGATNGSPLFEQVSCFAKRSSNVNAVIDLDGILAFIHNESGEGDDSKKTSAATNWFGFSKTEKPELWYQASALTHAGPQMPPTLFINSMVDRMHAGQSDLIKILEKNNIYSEVKVFKNAPHSFLLFHPWFDATIEIIISFIQNVFNGFKIQEVDSVSVRADSVLNPKND